MTIFFDTVQDHVTTGDRSCLACHRYRSRNGATWVECDHHPMVNYSTSAPPEDFDGAAIRRAKKCAKFEGEA